MVRCSCQKVILYQIRNIYGFTLCTCATKCFAHNYALAGLSEKVKVTNNTYIDTRSDSEGLKFFVHASGEKYVLLLYVDKGNGNVYLNWVHNGAWGTPKQIFP